MHWRWVPLSLQIRWVRPPPPTPTLPPANAPSIKIFSCIGLFPRLKCQFYHAAITLATKLGAYKSPQMVVESTENTAKYGEILIPSWIWPWRSRSIIPKTKGILTKEFSHFWSKFGNSSWNGWQVIARTKTCQQTYAQAHRRGRQYSEAPCKTLGPLFLTWINLNPEMDK